MSRQTEAYGKPVDGALRLTALVMAVAALVALLALTGCHDRKPPAASTPEPAALLDAADAGAGCEAIARGYVAPAMIPEAATGAGAFARATAGKVSLPAPEWTVERVAADPVAYRKAGESAERAAKGTQLWFWLKVAGGCALPVVLAFAKGIPGLGGVLGGFAELAWNAYAPTATKQSEEAQAVLASHTTNVLRMVKAVVPTNELRDAISRLPAGVVEAAKTHGIDLTTGNA